VQLAVRGANAQMNKIDPKIEEYYRSQCDLIGVDPEAFQPRAE